VGRLLLTVRGWSCYTFAFKNIMYKVQLFSCCLQDEQDPGCQL
jgi:hypothetical protein